ncbi:MAG: hypothetical protein WCK20_01005 [Thermoleophilia bacterium]
MKPRHLIPIILALMLTLIASSTATASQRYDHARQATSFFGNAVPTPGTSIENVWVVPEKLLAKKISVTADDITTHVVTATVDLEAGNGSTMSGTLTWENECHWKLAFVADSTATPSTAPTTTMKLNHIDGFIDNVGCEHHAQLTLKGYSIGESKVDINLSIVPGGFEGTTEMTDLVLGGTTYPRIKLSVSSLSHAVRLEGTMKSDEGTFTIDGHLTGKEMALEITGADLAFKTASFEITAFRVTTKYEVPETGCSTISGGIGGTLVMKKTTYTLHDASMKLVCGKMTEFKLAIDIEHEASPTEIYTGRLYLALDGDGGTFTELTQGHNGNGYQLASTDKQFGKALLGTLDMSKTRRISKHVQGRTFERHMTIGMVFGLSIYTNPGGSTYYGYIGAGGYFHADRLSGGFGCSYGSEHSDFSCLGTVRINPSWAGVYRIGVTV